MPVLAYIMTTLCVISMSFVLKSGRRAKTLPPGPPTIPLLGNLHQIPKSSTHYQFTEWAHEYGGIFSLKLGQGTAIVLTDPRLIKQLLDKRGSIYNDRPLSYIGNDLITGGHHILLMPYSYKWRRARKLMQFQFNENRVEKEHVKLIEAEATQMLFDFMSEPENLYLHPKRFSNSIIMSLIYGIRTRSTEVEHMRELYEVMEKWSAVMETGATPPVDLLPWLKYVPEWMLGSWKSRAREVSRGMNALYKKLADRVVKRRMEDVHKGCLLDYVLDQAPDVELTRHELSFFGGTIMEGGSDTTSSMILAFIHAMIKYPDVQKRAQEEIDAVINGGRSPLWSDYASLPYVAKVVKETMRWRPVTPLSVPHATNAGTVVIINVWGLHNTTHTEKESPIVDFDPDRFEDRTRLASEYAVSPDYTARDHYGYGAGRRLCPGIHLAERSLFIGIAKLLWAYEFVEKKHFPVDVHPKTGYSGGFLHCAKPFQCDVKLRPGRETFLREEFKSAMDVFSQFEI